MLAFSSLSVFFFLLLSLVFPSLSLLIRAGMEEVRVGMDPWLGQSYLLKGREERLQFCSGNFFAHSILGLRLNGGFRLLQVFGKTVLWSLCRKDGSLGRTKYLVMMKNGRVEYT